MSGQQLILRDHQLRQREQAEQLRSILGKLFLADGSMTKQVLHDVKRMLSPRADPCHCAFVCGRQLLRQAFLHRFDL